MFESIIKQFAQQAPAAVLYRGLVARVFSDERMNEIFHDYRERQVEGPLLFSTLMRLLTPVVGGGKPSLHASYVQQQEQTGVSCQSIYNKLQGVECPVSEALVRLPASELAQVIKKSRATKADPIAGYHALIIDGKRIDATEHRLKETRVLTNGPLPGTVLALFDTRLDLFVDVACSPDGHACERKVVEPLLDRLKPGCLYIADRNFCDGPLISRFLQAKSLFLLRQHGRSPAWRKIVGSKRRKIGKDQRGGTVYEQVIEVRLPDDTWQQVRRISIHLSQPIRDGDKVLHLLTNLPADVSALVIADAYGQRWTIETSFGHIAQSLRAEINTLAYPQAALLCFCLGLVLFNVISTLQSLLLKYSSSRGTSSLSYYYLALEIGEARLGLEIATQPADWQRYAKMSLPEFIAWVRSIARSVNLNRYRKHTRGPKHPPPRRKTRNRSTHISTHKLLLERT